MLVQIICSYTSAELEAFLQHITIMMNRRTRINAPKAEAQIMTASSHVITLSVQWVPSYRKNSSCVHLTKETEFVGICCCLYFAYVCIVHHNKCYKTCVFCNKEIEWIHIYMTEYTTSKHCMFTCRCESQMLYM